MEKVALVYNAVMELLKEEKNPFNITVSAIAEKSGIGKGTVYEYFKSKDDLFLQAFKYFIDQVRDEIQSISAVSFKEMFKAYYSLHIAMQRKCNAAYLTIIFGNSNFNLTGEVADSLKSILEPLQDCMAGYVLRMVRAGIEEGILPVQQDPDNIYFACMGVATSIFSTNSPFNGRMVKLDYETCYKAFVKLLS